jgi:hypothetical protein
MMLGLGAEKTGAIIQRVNSLKELADVRELRSFLTREGH